MAANLAAVNRLSPEHLQVALVVLLVWTATGVHAQTMKQVVLQTDGTPLCALDAPSRVVALSDVWTYPVTSSGDAAQTTLCVPDVAKCAWVCKQDGNCTSYNYNKELQQCELFYYRPLNYAPSQNCMHYWMQAFNGVCPNPNDFTPHNGSMIPSECCDFPFTFRGQLYLEGCALDASSHLGCYFDGHYWVNCLPPADHSVQYVLTNITFPTESTPVQVMVVNGWIVFHQKATTSLSYNRTFNEYKAGFGVVQTDFWLGLERVHQVTSFNGTYRLRIEMQLQHNLEWYSVEYNSFSIDTEANGYAIHVDGCTGDACDPFDSPANNTKQNHIPFSTWDRNNHEIPGKGNCANPAGSGFWFNNCSYILLTSNVVHRCYSIPPVNGNATTHNLITSRMMMKRDIQ